MIGDGVQSVQVEDLKKLGRQCHPNCLVCGDANQLGLKPHCRIDGDGVVECHFHRTPEFEGYPSQLHGGIIGLLLDAAMTHCLFAHGYVSVTGELRVRYRHPVDAHQNCLVRSWIRASHPPLRLVEAELVQEDQVKAIASAKFIDRR